MNWWNEFISESTGLCTRGFLWAANSDDKSWSFQIVILGWLFTTNSMLLPRDSCLRHQVSEAINSHPIPLQWGGQTQGGGRMGISFHFRCQWKAFQKGMEGERPHALSRVFSPSPLPIIYYVSVGFISQQSSVGCTPAHGNPQQLYGTSVNIN